MMVGMMLSIRYGICEKSDSYWEEKVKIGLESSGMSDRVKEIWNMIEGGERGEWMTFIHIYPVPSPVALSPLFLLFGASKKESR